MRPAALVNRLVRVRRFNTAPPNAPKMDEARIRELERKLEEKQNKTSGFVNFLGALGAVVLGAAFVDEVLNVIVGIKSSEWDYTEGEIVSEPIVSYAGAMIKRREVGIQYKYFVEPEDDDDDDDDDDDPDAGHYLEDSIWATPRKGLLTGLIDFIVEPDPKGPFGQQLAELYPIGSKVRVYYNSESPSRACLVPGLAVPNGSFRLPFYLVGVPALMGVARSKMALPVRFAFFAIGVLLWTEVSEESEKIFTNTSLKQWTAKPLRSHGSIRVSPVDVPVETRQ